MPGENVLYVSAIAVENAQAGCREQDPGEPQRESLPRGIEDFVPSSVEGPAFHDGTIRADQKPVKRTNVVRHSVRHARTSIRPFDHRQQYHEAGG